MLTVAVVTMMTQDGVLRLWEISKLIVKALAYKVKKMVFHLERVNLFCD